MHPVESFLQSGLLPFVGREEEIAQIAGLWRGSIDAGRLRGMILTAEAGTGKSRLLEEVIGRIRQEGGVVVHAKLYPEATNDLAQMIGGAISRNPDLADAADSFDPGSLNDIVTFLRRTSRLRRTLFILEDIHLLPPEARPDLDMLVRGLADETLSLLVVTRPVKLAARGILEPVLVANLELGGLKGEEIAHLWSKVFDSTLRREALNVLERETLGIPLALRSAFRGALQAGTIQERRKGGDWNIAVSLPIFESAVRQSVSVVVEGLVVGLPTGLRQAIASIATLGEVFARESAEALVDDPGFIDQLIGTNLILQAGHTVSPLAGSSMSDRSQGPTFPASRFPLLAFTHSLVQNQLAAEARVDRRSLLHVLGDNLPLYSLVPFSLLGEDDLPGEIEGELLLRAVTRSTNVAQALDRTSSWREGERVWAVVQSLFRQLKGKIPEDEWSRTEIRHAVDTLSMNGRRNLGKPVWVEALEEVERLTSPDPEEDPPLSPTQGYARLFSASHRLIHYGCRGGEREVLERTDRTVDEVLALYPDYRYTPPVLYYLSAIGGVVAHTGDLAIARDLERRVGEILDSEEAPPELRAAIVKSTQKFLLPVFETPEELAARFALLERIQEEFDRQIDVDESYFDVTKAEFLLVVGRFEEAADVAEHVASVRSELGLWTSYLSCRGLEMIARAAFEGTADEVIELGAGIIEDSVPGVEDAVVRRSVLNTVREIAILRGDFDMIDAFRTRAGLPEQLIGERKIEAIWQEIPEEAVPLLSERRPDDQRGIATGVWNRWREIVGGGDAGEVEEATPIEDIFTRPHLRINQLLETAGTIHLLRMTGGLGENTERRTGAIDACERGLAWVSASGGPCYATPLIDLLDELGERERAESWRAKIEVPEAEVGRMEEVEREKRKIGLSMLGKIRIAIPPDGYAPVRGVRIRTILGLMVANEMLERPLSGAEFTHLAGGGDPDPEHARKKKNMGVVRIREIMGREAVLTDGEYPELNPELVEVDLLVAHRLITEAESMLAKGSIVRALPLVGDALDLLGGEVPFPTLYDDFFEAARSDLDRKVRELLLNLGRGMLAEGETPEGIQILRRAISERPGDEEIAEVLAELLERRGEEVEAERVRIVGG